MSKEDNKNYNEEEYHFAVEPDEIESSDNVDFEQTTAADKPKFDFNRFVDINKIKLFLQENVQIRNAIVAVIVIILLVMIYKFTSSMVAKKREKVNNLPTQAILQQPQSFKQNNSQRLTMSDKQQSMHALSAQADIGKETKIIQESLSKLQQGQDIANAKVSTLSSEYLKISTEYQELSEKLNKLAIQVEKLASVVEDQSRTIMSLSTRRTNYTRQAHGSYTKRLEYMKYYVKAVVPGRAWLIAENGSTLTVRRGSTIPEYGIVTMIDVSQGRVLTNSGRIIAFAQNDS